MMNPTPSSETELIALNREIAALVRAGIPLEMGLRSVSGGGGSRLGKLSNRIANRLSQGQTLTKALSEEGRAVSPAYLSLIEAGLASGKLPESLESLAEAGQLMQDTRRRVFLSAMYPIICALMAYNLFCFFIGYIAPHILDAVESFPHNWATRFLQVAYENRGYFTQTIPCVGLILLVVTILFRNNLTRGIWNALTSFQWMMGRNLSWAQFTRLLALQVEHKAPLDKAFLLAAESTADTRLHRDARAVADELSRGGDFAKALKATRALPPLVCWMLSTSEKQGTLATTLRQLTEMYRRRALRRAAMLKIWLPVAMTYCLSATIGLAYGIGFILPLRAFLEGLMQE